MTLSESDIFHLALAALLVADVVLILRAMWRAS